MSGPKAKPRAAKGGFSAKEVKAIRASHAGWYARQLRARRNRMRPISPGEVLREQLDALDLSAAGFARKLHVSTSRITGILRGERALTADTARRLERFFGTSAQFWLNLQTGYDLRRREP